MIDEDLDMDCNELPSTLINLMFTIDKYPFYKISSNATKNSSVSFILDTRTSSSENCPGFKFESISVILRGESLNTARMSFTPDVKVKAESGSFSLNTTIAEMTLSQISQFSEVSCTQLYLAQEEGGCDLKPILSSQKSAKSNNITKEDVLKNKNKVNKNVDNKKFKENGVNYTNGKRLKYGKEEEEEYQTGKEFGVIYAVNCWAEPNVFKLSIYSDAIVEFQSESMIVNLSGCPPLIVNFTGFNYSNAFYFELMKSGISFEVYGDMIYPTEYPHNFFLNCTSYDIVNVNITIGEGNYISDIGNNHGMKWGNFFSLFLIMSELHFNNSHMIETLSLTYVNFFPHSPITMPISDIGASYGTGVFEFYGDGLIQGDLILNCSYLVSDEYSVIRCIEGKTLNITARYIQGDVSIPKGDVYLTQEITGTTSIKKSYQNLHFVNFPKINLKKSYSDNECPFNITGELTGSAGLYPLSATVNQVNIYFCSADNVSLNISNFKMSFDPIKLSYNNFMNYSVIYEDKKIGAKAQRKLPGTLSVCYGPGCDNEDWVNNYYYDKKLTFTIKADATIDLTQIEDCSELSSVSIVPNELSTNVFSVQVKINQKIADVVKEWIFGVLTKDKFLNLEFINDEKVKIKGVIKLYESLTFNSDNFKNELDFSALSYLSIFSFYTLDKIKDFITDIQCVVINQISYKSGFFNKYEYVNSFEFTESGWHIVTSLTEYDIKGIVHPNITLLLKYFDKLNLALDIKVSASKYIFRMYFLFSFTTNEYLPTTFGGTNLNLLKDLFIIIQAGYVSIETPHEAIPVFLNDMLYDGSTPADNKRGLSINRTRWGLKTEILFMEEPIYLLTDFEFKNPEKNVLYIEFTKEAYFGGTVNNAFLTTGLVKFKFRNMITFDGVGPNRFWSESNGITLVNGGQISSPSFLDSVNMYLDDLLHYTRIPTIRQGHDLIKMECVLLDSLEINLTDHEERSIINYFNLLSSRRDLSFQDVRDKIEFRNDKMSISYGNAKVDFDIVIDYCNKIEPDTFTVNGIFRDLNDLYIGYYLIIKSDSGNNNISNGIIEKTMEIEVIAGISMGAIAAFIVIVIVVISVANRKNKSLIDNILLSNRREI